ncbi:DNA polymerase Y family protein [Streptomyces sp. YJ-C3]
MSAHVFFHLRMPQGGELPDLMAIERFTPVAQALPPTAAVAQVGGALRLFDAGPTDLAYRLRLQAMAWFSLNVVVGIGPSWTVAAMASARTGSHGVKHVSDAETEAFLRPLPVGDLYGIRRAQAETLRRFGVRSIGQLAALPATTALRILGRHGRVLQERARGTDRRAISPGGTPRSCSVRADFAQDVLDSEQLRTTAARLAAELGGRLRLAQQAAGGRRQAAGGRRQAAGGRRQAAGGRRQAAGGRRQAESL